MMIHMVLIFIKSSLTAGVQHARYPWNLDSRGHQRVHPERSFLSVGRDGYATGHLAEQSWCRSSQAPGKYSAGHVPHGEAGPARACAWYVGAYPMYKVLPTPNGCWQALSFLRI